MPLRRCHLVEPLGSFLPRMSNEVAFRLVVKLAEGFNYRRIYWHKQRRRCERQTFSISPNAKHYHQTTGPLLPTNSGLACLRWKIRSSEFAGRGGVIAFYIGFAFAECHLAASPNNDGAAANQVVFTTGYRASTKLAPRFVISYFSIVSCHCKNELPQ